jgi:hypothetical protein
MHFVGDIHMPLHAVAPLKRPGGVWVRIGDTIDSLHLWWDNGFVDALASDEGTLADMLEDQFPAARRRDWTFGTPEDWANESFAIAQDFLRAYGIAEAVKANAITPERPLEIDPSVLDDVAPIIKQRLYLAGLRLARLLNDSFE